ncbi:hypothetical protein GPROT2_00496 [Gammaproteobacteria bacterium]|jgi:phosphatidylglycerophosphatase A|nr:hypothetical protein GPROT2_00496 [Gammaproteobacteria bacterium]
MGGVGRVQLVQALAMQPIREADHRIPGGLGIMLDDALAAAFAAAVVSSLWKLSVFLH